MRRFDVPLAAMVFGLLLLIATVSGFSKQKAVEIPSPIQNSSMEAAPPPDDLNEDIATVIAHMLSTQTGVMIQQSNLLKRCYDLDKSID